MRAQLRSNALLREWLTPPLARILEVGMGLCTFAAELADAGRFGYVALNFTMS